MLLEYVWIDGRNNLRSKTRIADNVSNWTFDGSSTFQSNETSSDLILKPVRIFPDFFRTKNDYIVFCEVYNSDDTPHETNHRRSLADLVEDELVKNEKIQIGFEQEYMLYDINGLPLSKCENKHHYCGIGPKNYYGRVIMEEHIRACLYSKIGLYGINSEVTEGQYEYQLNPLEPLDASDQLWISRYYLERIAEKFLFSINFDPKPLENLNGSGCHTNISTEKTREDIKEIYNLIDKFSLKHKEHILVYGQGNEKRLTGKNETSNYDTFTFGISNRKSSVRIPLNVHKEGKGYFEDRRPASNIDPYLVSEQIVRTIVF